MIEKGVQNLKFDNQFISKQDISNAELSVEQTAGTHKVDNLIETFYKINNQGSTTASTNHQTNDIPRKNAVRKHNSQD